MARLTGKIALVTGAARGMGAAHARAIVANGGKVVLGDVLDEPGRALADELGAEARYVHLDVTSTEDWAVAVDVARTEFGGLNVLVNNAGVVSAGPLETYAREEWDRVLAINLTGPFLGIQACQKELIAAAPASIINVSSVAAMSATPMMLAYVASKWALRGLTKAVALELGASDVRCNSVHPGVIRTPMLDGLDVEHLVAGPLHRIGEPAEVANLIVYLASDESSFSTGSEFIVDGGQTAGTMPEPTPSPTAS